MTLLLAGGTLRVSPLPSISPQIPRAGVQRSAEGPGQPFSRVLSLRFLAMLASASAEGPFPVRSLSCFGEAPSSECTLHDSHMTVVCVLFTPYHVCEVASSFSFTVWVQRQRGKGRPRSQLVQRSGQLQTLATH